MKNKLIILLTSFLLSKLFTQIAFLFLGDANVTGQEKVGGEGEESNLPAFLLVREYNQTTYVFYLG